MTPHIGRVLGGFYNRVVCRLTGRQPRRGRYRVCIYFLLEDAMVESILQDIET